MNDVACMSDDALTLELARCMKVELWLNEKPVRGRPGIGYCPFRPIDDGADIVWLIERWHGPMSIEFLRYGPEAKATVHAHGMVFERRGGKGRWRRWVCEAMLGSMSI